MNLLEKVHNSVNQIQELEEGTHQQKIKNKKDDLRQSNNVDNEEEKPSTHFDKHHPLFRTMEDFVNLKEIGGGTFGVCYKAIDTKNNNSECVIKKIPFNSVRDVKLIGTELGILRKLDHPNIVKYFSSFMYENAMCIVMEYCNGGSLKDWMDQRETVVLQQKKKLQTNQTSTLIQLIEPTLFWSWCFMICSGMEEIHKQSNEMKTFFSKQFFECRYHSS